MKKIIAIMLLALCLLMAGFIFVLTNETGMRFLVGFIQGVSGESFKVGRVSGTLVTGWKFENITIKNSDAHVEIFEMGMEWQPGLLFDRQLQVDVLHLQGVTIRLQDKQSYGVSETKPQIFEPSDILFPIAILFDNVVFNNIVVRAPDGEELSSVDHLSFRAGYQDGMFNVDDFILRSPDYELDLGGSVDTAREWSLGLESRWSVIFDEYGPISGTFRLEGALDNPVVIADVVDPFPLHLEIECRNLLNNPQWVLTAQIPGVDLAEVISTDLSAEIAGRLRMQGDLHQWSASLTADLTNSELEPVEVNLTGKGDKSSMNLDSLSVNSFYGNIVGEKIRAEWGDVLTWQGTIHFNEVNLNEWNANNLPIHINSSLFTKGRYEPGADLQGNIDFNVIQIRVHEEVINGDAQLRFNGQKFVIDGIKLHNNNTLLQADGELEYALSGTGGRPALSWKGGLQLTDFDPALFAPDYPGKLSLEGFTRGKIINQSVIADVQLGKLSGTLRGHNITGEGLARFHDGSLDLEKLFLASGNTEIQLTGRVDDTLGMSVTVSSPNLGELIAEAGGQLDLEGNISGSRELPRFDVNLSGGNLFWGTNTLDVIQGNVEGSPDFGSEMDVFLSVEGLRLEGLAIDQAEVSVSGTAENHDMHLSISSEQGLIKSDGKGHLDEQWNWKGSISRTVFSNMRLGEWIQQGESSLAISPDSAQVDNLCFGRGGGNERFCGTGEWQNGEKNWNGILEWNDIDFTGINTRDILPRPLHGYTEGKIEVEGDSQKVQLAKIHIGAQDTTIGEKGQNGDWEMADIDRIMLDATLYNEKLQGGLTVNMADTNSLAATIGVDNVGRFDQDIRRSSLSGVINVSAENLAFVAPLTEYYVYPSGTLSGKLDLFGSVVDPHAAGTLVLSEGVIDFPTFGVNLRDVVFNVVGEGTVLTISAEGSSGPGRLSADGSLSFSADDLLGEFNFAGENIEVFNLPEYIIRANPDLRLVFDTDGGALFGKLTIPHAILTPEKMTNSLSESDDVVFLNGATVEVDTDWFFKTLLDVHLGDDVRLDGYGITGNLRGDLEVEKLSGMFVTGTGVLTLVNGQFSIYGRSLDIERGRVFFNGGPIDDPGVDVRAQKIVADQEAGPSGVTVGVDVSGTAESLEFKLFSDPYMEESDILAYMVVGRSMSNTSSGDKNILSSAALALGVNQGTELIQGLTSILPVDDVYFEGATSGERLSLVVGKRLTDELFIGYDHNFFDQLGEVTIRYELGRGFYVESRTSAEATGADLLFSFER